MPEADGCFDLAEKENDHPAPRGRILPGALGAANISPPGKPLPPHVVIDARPHTTSTTNFSPRVWSADGITAVLDVLAHGGTQEPMTAFWSAFWPNFTATILGVFIAVILGGTVTSYLERKATRRREATERAASVQSLVRALGVLAPATELNLQRLRTALADLTQGKYIVGVDLNRSAWDATKAEIIPRLHNTELSMKIGYAFEKLDRFAVHSERHADYFIGIRAGLGGAENNRLGLGNELVAFAAQLVTDFELLLKAISATKDKLPRPDVSAT